MSSEKQLRCTHCSKHYPVRQGVPVLLDTDNLPEHLQGQIRYFNRAARIYGTPQATAPWQRKYIEHLFQNLKSKKNKILVDDACGSGYVSLGAARKGMYVFACDVNLSGLVQLRKYAETLGLSDKIFPVCCRAEALPFRADSADAIVANAILEHLPNEQDAISDISRIAKKGAIAIITVPLAYYLLNPLFLLINYVHDRQIGHLRRYTKEKLKKRFHDWKTLSVTYTGHTAKVIKTLLNLIRPLFDEEEIEKEDARKSAEKVFASNISIIFLKK